MYAVISLAHLSIRINLDCAWLTLLLVDTSFVAFVVACSAKGRKISMYPSGSKAVVVELRQWITRLLGGEIAQRETIPELFG